MKKSLSPLLRVVVNNEDKPQVTADKLVARGRPLLVYDWQELRRFLESMRGVPKEEIIGLRLEMLKAVARYFKVPPACPIIRATRKSLLAFLWELEAQTRKALYKKGAGPLVDRIMRGFQEGTIALFA